MPFTTSISLTQGADCSQFIINDTSTYNVEATGTFTLRKLTIQKSDGTYLVSGGVTYNNYTWLFIMSSFYTNAHKMAINPGLEKDYRFVKDLQRLFIEQESAKKAGIDGDAGAAQSCLDRGKTISDNLKIGY